MTPGTWGFTITIFLTLSGTSIKKNSSASRTRVSFLMQLLRGAYFFIGSMFQTFHTSHPKRLLESARHGFYHGMMEDVLNDEMYMFFLNFICCLMT
jgi:hypothetical protein